MTSDGHNFNDFFENQLIENSDVREKGALVRCVFDCITDYRRKPFQRELGQSDCPLTVEL